MQITSRKPHADVEPADQRDRVATRSCRSDWGHSALRRRGDSLLVTDKIIVYR